MSGFIRDNFTKSILGGGLPGSMPINVATNQTLLNPGPQYGTGLIGGGGSCHDCSSGMEGGNERSLSRQILRNSFGNKSYVFVNLDGNMVKVSPDYLSYRKKAPLGPFRLAMTAGDPAGAYYNNMNTDPRYGKPANQVGAINPNLGSSPTAGYKGLAGHVSNNGTAAYTGNPKFVYDGSDYTKFKKLQAINRTYNDLSFGGSTNSSFSALKRSKRGIGGVG